MIARLIQRAGDAHRALLSLVFGVLGPRFAYEFMDFFAGLIYRLLPPIRIQTEFQLAAAARATGQALDVARIAKCSFLHRMRDLADLLLAERNLRPARLDAIGGRLSAPDHDALVDAQQRRKPVILLTAYFGPFDLLPILLGYNGIPAAALYRPHANEAFDRLRSRIRGRAGCELIPIAEALVRLPQILEAGGIVGVVADHHDQRRGIDGTFLGLPTRVPRTVGILAARHEADVVVAAIRRTGPFRFAIEVETTIKPDAWAAEADPVEWITRQYLRALERIVWRRPEQYHWLRARWGRELVASLESPIVRE
ncbi:MAG: lysophospholipid acyltransferase family protein [Planctomycetes bacterium]|nr:lysophospholipid acyltransferase family protein [Planctomycetota bacterium]